MQPGQIRVWQTQNLTVPSREKIHLSSRFGHHQTFARHCWHWVVALLNLLTTINILGFCWILSSQMTRHSGTTAISILCYKQAASIFFPMFNCSYKNVLFVPSVRPCMHHSYDVTSGSHTCRDCVWPTTLGAGLGTACRGERVLLTTRFNVTFLPSRPYSKNVYMFFERCTKSNNIWVRALTQADCWYSFFKLWTIQLHFILSRA